MIKKNKKISRRNKKISRRNKKISRRNKTKHFGGSYNNLGSWVDNKTFTIIGGNYRIDVEEKESSKLKISICYNLYNMTDKDYIPVDKDTRRELFQYHQSDLDRMTILNEIVSNYIFQNQFEGENGKNVLVNYIQQIMTSLPTSVNNRGQPIYMEPSSKQIKIYNKVKYLYPTKGWV